MSSLQFTIEDNIDIPCFLPQSSKIAKGTKGDATELKPSLMAAVPVSVHTRLLAGGSCAFTYSIYKLIK